MARGQIASGFSNGFQKFKPWSLNNNGGDYWIGYQFSIWVRWYQFQLKQWGWIDNRNGIIGKMMVIRGIRWNQMINVGCKNGSKNYMNGLWLVPHFASTLNNPLDFWPTIIQMMADFSWTRVWPTIILILTILAKKDFKCVLLYANRASVCSLTACLIYGF